MRRSPSRRRWCCATPISSPPSAASPRSRPTMRVGSSRGCAPWMPPCSKRNSCAPAASPRPTWPWPMRCSSRSTWAWPESSRTRSPITGGGCRRARPFSAHCRRSTARRWTRAWIPRPRPTCGQRERAWHRAARRVWNGADMSTPDTFRRVLFRSGMAGCLLAHRLSENGRHSVCLLESGPPDRPPFIRIPAGFIKVGYDPRYTWPFETAPSEGTAGRRVTTRLGRTLGGSSAINGFNYTRGTARDYDGWAAQGNPGWSYAEVLPCFKRTERRIGGGEAPHRGHDGLLPITDCDWRHPLCDGFIRSAQSLGIGPAGDYNLGVQGGAGYYQRWIHRGRRVSAATAFLKPARGRANLEV